MGIYGDHVLPRIVNCACGLKAVAPLRQRVCEGLEGEVVEIGFGSGHNVPFYPTAVARVMAVEPADVGWKLAGKRLGASRVPVQRSGLDGQSLPFEDDSFDSALSTWTMCTIPDVETARCTSSSTAWRRTRRCGACSTASSRCRSGSSGAAT
jgi:hypothetical protein